MPGIGVGFLSFRVLHSCDRVGGITLLKTDKNWLYSNSAFPLPSTTVKPLWLFNCGIPTLSLLVCLMSVQNLLVALVMSSLLSESGVRISST